MAIEQTATTKRRSDDISELLSLCSVCVSDCVYVHTAVCNCIFIDVCSHIYLFLQDVCVCLCVFLVVFYVHLCVLLIQS